MIEKECFSYRNGRCKALKVKKCEGEGGLLFKTQTQTEEDQKKVFRRIKSLSGAISRNIMGTFIVEGR